MMKKMRKDVIVAYAVLIVSTLVFVWTALSMITATNADLSYQSDTFEPQFDMYHIGVTLNENGNPKAWRNYQQEGGDGDVTEGHWHVNGQTSLLENLDVKVGPKYGEVLTVSNSGTIDEYVRVTIYRYWMDPVEDEPESKNQNDEKNRDLNPEYIVLHLVNLKKPEEGNEGYWIKDEEYQTDERTVLYYAYPLTKSDGQYFDPENGTSVPFADQFYIDPEVKTFFYQERETDPETNYTTVTNYYLYDGKVFCVDIQVDGVQVNNAKDAIRSAWGRDVSIDPDTGELSLN